MANEIEIVVKGRNEFGKTAAEVKAQVDSLKKSTSDLSSETNKLSTEEAKTGTVLDSMVASFKDAGASTKNLKNDFSDTGKSAEDLHIGIKSVTDDAAKLTEAFKSTGASDPLKKLKDDVDGGGSSGVFSRLKTKLTNVLNEGGSSGGKKGGESFISSFGESLSGLGDVMMPVIVGTVAALSPLIGATIAAGVLTGIGAGGIATGVIAQLSDPRVQAAGADLAATLGAELKQDTAVFRDPIISALDQIKNATGRLIGSIDWAKLAPQVDKLGGALAFMIDEIGPGLNKAISASMPLLDEMGHLLPIIGMEISAMFSHIADSGPGAVEALRTVGYGIAGVIELLGYFIEGLAISYDNILKFGDAMTEIPSKLGVLAPWIAEAAKGLHSWIGEIQNGTAVTETYIRQLGGAATGFHTAGDAAVNMKAQITELNATTDNYAKTMTDKLLGSMMAIDTGALGVATSLTSIDKSLKENGRQLDIHTEKGQANRSTILGAVQANIQLYDAQINGGISATDAAQAYDANTAALDRQLRKAGLTQGQIDGLIGKYKNVPDSVNTNIVLKGLADAINDLNSTLRLINGLHDKTVTITMKYNSTGSAAPRGSQPGYNAVGSIIGAAAAGPISTGMTWVGEDGPELLSLPTGTRVFPSSTSAAMASRGGDGAALGAMASQPRGVVFSGATDTAFAQAFMHLYNIGAIHIS